MALGISIREFARRAGCDDKVVRRKVKTEHIKPFEDGTIDPRYLDLDWRSGEHPVSATGTGADAFADGESLESAAEEMVSAPGGAKWSKAEAERIKENYAALLRQLEFERESGLVVEIEDVIVAVASEYAVVRNRLLGIGSKVAPSAAVLKSAEEIKAIIDEEVIAALNELAIDDGQRDFGDLRKSLQHRFGPSSDEAAPSP